jgi:hypothetical protein
VASSARVHRVFDENGSFVVDHVLAHDELGNLNRPFQELAPHAEADLIHRSVNLTDVDPDALFVPESLPQILAEKSRSGKKWISPSREI